MVILILFVFTIVCALLIRKEYCLYIGIVKGRELRMKENILLARKGIILETSSEYAITQEVLDSGKKLMSLLRIEWGNMNIELDERMINAYYHIFEHYLETYEINLDILEGIKGILAKNLNKNESMQPIDYSICLKTLNKKMKIKKGFFKSDKYKLLVPVSFEIVYLKYILQDYNVTLNDIEEVLTALKLNKKDMNYMKVVLHNLFINRNIRITRDLLFSKKNDEKNILNGLIDEFLNHQSYLNKPIVNVAVVATMSSGKSTLVNALLGSEYIPSKNEACTAKVTTIYDNDNMKRLIGYCGAGTGNQEFKTNITLENLKNWNNDKFIENIVLERDLDGVNSHKRTLVIHDTPGTNYSQDASHVESTFNFLSKKNIDVILFVINACNIQSMDNDFLLRRIKQEIVDDQTKVVFLLNKIDNFDYEKGDDIHKSILNIDEQLVEIGFEDNIIIPISAYAGHLFKKALSNIELSKKESVDFRAVYSIFYEDDTDLRKYVYNAIESDNNNPVLWEEEECQIYKWNFKKSNVQKALNNSGVLYLEYILEKLIN